MLQRQRTDRTATLVNAIIQEGPQNYSLISRLTGIPESSVRYAVTRLAQTGFSIRPAVRYEALGLTRHWVFIDLPSEYREFDDKFFDAINRVGYLTYFSRFLPSGRYVAIVAVPDRFKVDYISFLQSLVREEIITGFEAHPLLWIRYLPMQTSCYNFEKMIWDIDWRSLDDAKPSLELSGERVEPVKFDRQDLLILKELQIDPLRPLFRIAEKLEINPKTAYYHYNAHILKRRLIEKYFIRWIGYADQRYTMLFTKFWYKDLSPEELMLAQRTFRSIPLTWSDSVSEDGDFYMAEVVVPPNQYAQLLSYIERHTWRFAKKGSHSVVDAPFGATYTIPYNMFVDGEWRFSAEAALARVALSMAQVRG